MATSLFFADIFRYHCRCNVNIFICWHEIHFSIAIAVTVGYGTYFMKTSKWWNSVVAATMWRNPYMQWCTFTWTLTPYPTDPHLFPIAYHAADNDPLQWYYYAIMIFLTAKSKEFLCRWKMRSVYIVDEYKLKDDQAMCRFSREFIIFSDFFTTLQLEKKIL